MDDLFRLFIFVCFVATSNALTRGMYVEFNYVCQNQSDIQIRRLDVDCTGFIQCSGTTAYWHTCKKGQFFDGGVSCSGDNSNCPNLEEVAAFRCPIIKRLKFPHPDSCTMFYNCEQTTARGPFKIYEDECPFPTFFDADTRQCLDPKSNNVSCTGTEPIDQCSYRSQCGNPTCVGMPDGLNHFTNQPFDIEYVLCSNETIVEKRKCTIPGQIFDPIQKRCTADYQASIPAYCATNPQDVFIDPALCSAYYNCSNINGSQTSTLAQYQDECIYPFLYDQVLRACKYFTEVMCGLRPEPVAPCDYLIGACNKRQECFDCSETCKGKPDGDNVYSGKPSQTGVPDEYLVCSGERTINRKKCLSGKLFDPVSRLCSYEIGAEALDHYCAANPTMLIAHPGECSQFYDCSKLTASGNFHKYLRECYYPELFDAVTKTCKRFDQVSCDFRREPRDLCEYLQFQCIGTACVTCSKTMPSCVGKPDGNYPLIGEEMTAHYIECVGGQFSRALECNKGDVFDMFSKQCANNVTSEAMGAYCAINQQSAVANPKHCGQYYECPAQAAGIAQLLECPYPDVFSISRKQCKPYTEVDCSERVEMFTPCDYLTVNPCNNTTPNCICALPSCLGKVNGFVAMYPGVPQKYYECRDQRTFVTDCSPKRFDATIGRCEGTPEPTTPAPTEPPTQPPTQPPTEPPTQPPTEPPTQPPIPTTEPTPAPRTDMDLATARIECAADPNLTAIPHPENCHWFFNCSNLSGVSECLYPSLFDTTSKFCVEYMLANCLGTNQPKKMCDYDQYRSKFPTCENQTICPECELHYPSCIGKPNNFQDGLTIDKTKYYECRDNRTNIYSCEPPKEYDSAANMCIVPTAVPEEASTAMEASGFCIQDQTSIIPHRDHCAKYFICNNTSVAKVQMCPYPKQFHTSLKICSENVACGARAEYKTACVYWDVLARYPSCVEGNVCPPCEQDYPSCVGSPDNTVGPLPTSNTRYYKCVNERTYLRDCNPGEIFDAALKTCTPDVSVAMASNTTEATQFCLLGQTVKILHRDNCARYFTCTNKIAKEEMCPYPMSFDASTRNCQMNVNCGTRTEFKEPCSYLSVLDRYPYCEAGRPCRDCEFDHPSCVGKPDNFTGQVFTDPSSYYVCQNERTALKECSVVGNIYLPSQRGCGPDPTNPIVPLEPGNVAVECAQYPTKVYPMVGSCARYYDCRVGRNGPLGPFVAECRYPFLFDGFDGRCSEPDVARCGARKVEIDRCEYETVRQRYCTTPGPCVTCDVENPSCRGKPDQFIGGIPINGAMFYTCLNSRTTIGQCTTGKMFNAQLGRCEFINAPTTPSTSTTTAAPIVSRSGIATYCTAKPNGVAAHPDSCAMYWNCSHPARGQAPQYFEPYLQECSYPYYFNLVSSSCDSFNTVACGIRKEVITPCEFISFTKTLCNNLTSCAFCENAQLSCRGKADGFKDVMLLNSNQYFECQNQRTTIGTCPSGQTFDSALAKCQAPNQPTIPVLSSARDAEPLCARNATARYPHAMNCAQYFDCSIQNGPYGRFLAECPYPDLFDPPSSSCQDHSLVSCGKRYEPRLRCEYYSILTQYCAILGTSCLECDAQNPSCIAQTDGLKGAIPESRTQYYTCVKERTILSNCQNNFEFDRGSRKCIPLKLLSSSAEAETYCRQNPTGLYPSTVSCAQYFNCSQITFGKFGRYLQECPYPKLFDIDSRSCMEPTSVICGVRPELKNPCQYLANMETYTGTPCVLPSCVGKINGLHHYPGKELEREFIQCRDSRLISVQTCEANQYFDPMNKNCRVALTQSAVNFFCEKYVNIRTANPLNCAQYINCMNKTANLIECGYPGLFDTTTLKCQQPSLVTCGSRFEPMTPCQYSQNQPCPAGQPNCSPCEERFPSCLGLQDGNQPYTARPPSSFFFTCKNSRTTGLVKCTSDIFNPITRKCGGNITSAYVKSVCQKFPTARFADPSWCSRYYDCSKPFSGALGMPFLQECSYPELYSTDDNACVNIFRNENTVVKCGLRNEPFDACDYFEHCGYATYPTCPNCTELIPSCKNRLDRRFYNYKDDPFNNQYYYCYRGRTVLYGKCQPYERFDVPNGRCMSKNSP